MHKQLRLAPGMEQAQGVPPSSSSFITSVLSALEGAQWAFANASGLRALICRGTDSGGVSGLDR